MESIDVVIERENVKVFDDWNIALSTYPADGRVFSQGTRPDPNKITPDSILPEYFRKEHNSEY